jgi:hypothetical protein
MKKFECPKDIERFQLLKDDDFFYGSWVSDMG